MSGGDSQLFFGASCDYPPKKWDSHHIINSSEDCSSFAVVAAFQGGREWVCRKDPEKDSRRVEDRPDLLPGVERPLDLAGDSDCSGY